MNKKLSYYDGIPQWIRDLSDEELAAAIKAEEERLEKEIEKIKHS